MTTRSGNLRRKLNLQARSRVEDGGGGFEQGWTTTEEGLRGRVTPRSGGERVIGDNLAGVITYTISLRFSSRTSGITNLMRLVDARSGVIYDIKSAWPDEREKKMMITAQRGVRSE